MRFFFFFFLLNPQLPLSRTRSRVWHLRGKGDAPVLIWSLAAGTLLFRDDHVLSQLICSVGFPAARLIRPRRNPAGMKRIISEHPAPFWPGLGKSTQRFPGLPPPPLDARLAPTCRLIRPRRCSLCGHFVKKKTKCNTPAGR